MLQYRAGMFFAGFIIYCVIRDATVIDQMSVRSEKQQLRLPVGREFRRLAVSRIIYSISSFFQTNLLSVHSTNRIFHSLVDRPPPRSASPGLLSSPHFGCDSFINVSTAVRCLPPKKCTANGSLFAKRTRLIPLLLL